MGLQTFRSLIESGRPVLLDGATGTELYSRGIFINRCFEDANLSNPSLVLDLHREYLRAGAQVLSTNSWGANRYKLAQHNLHDLVGRINETAARLARDAAEGSAYVLGSMGPLGVRIEPWGPTSFAECRAAFREQIEGLLKGGADLLSFETFLDITELQQAILAARDLDSAIPIFAHVVINQDGLSPIGSPIDWSMKKLDEWAVDVVGLNCSVGPQPMMSALPKIRAATKRPISLQPNAGLPKVVDGRTIYMCTPEYMGEFARRAWQEGVQFVGGCCGTSPEHIRAMAQALRQATAMRLADSSPGESGLGTAGAAGSHDLPEVKRVAATQKSSWAAKIANGDPVYSVELLPPSGVQWQKIVEQSAQLRDAGIDAINIPDGPRASARMSAILTAVMIEQRAQIETVLHYTCRDRNLLGMQSDLLGAHAIGLRNVLLITGDPPKMGSYPSATGVFDVDAIGLTNMAHRLNGGLDLGGRPIGEPTALSLGVGVNPAAKDFEHEMKRFHYKIDAGAEWAITQPVFDIHTMERFLERLQRDRIELPIIAGVWPLVSFRNAQFMRNEVPGIVIPDNLMDRMARADSPENAKREGVSIAKEMVEALRKSVAGFQVSAPFGRIDLAVAVVGKDLRPSPSRIAGRA